MTTKYDALVVGSGAAGSAASWLLAKDGMRVACLERGDWEDYSVLGTTYPLWEHQRQTVHNPVIALRQGPFDFPVNDKESPIAAAGYNAVGGSTVLFSGHFPRFHRNDFDTRLNDGVVEEWPISYEALLPFFDLNEFMMTVGGKVGDPYFPEISSLRPPTYLGTAGQLVESAFRSVGWHIWPSYSAILTGEGMNGRAPCSNLGPCNNGCPTQSKSTADVVYLKPGLDMGLDLYTQAAVSQVLVKGGRVRGVRYHDSAGHERELFADRVLLAASALGTPRILLNSDGAKGVANSSDLVGRNLMMHPMAYAEGIFAHDLDTDIGPQGAFLYSLQHRDIPDEDVQLGYMMHVLRGTSPLEAARSALSRNELEFGGRLPSSFGRFYRRQLGIAIVAEDKARPSNRVRLDTESTDRFGVPGLIIEYKIDSNTRKILKHGLQSAEKILTVAGSKRTYKHAPLRNVGWHTMGTARMGLDPSKSVVGPTGEAHDVRGLYVVDSSTFVTGSCVNPANTVQSLALYLAKGITRDKRF
jgi:choline dehydrogenase-like flavoprotein